MKIGRFRVPTLLVAFLRETRGLTLFEILMSITLLTAAIGFLLPLIHQAYVYGHSGDQASLAYAIAQSRVANIRSRVADPQTGLAFFEADDLGQPASPDPDNPEFLVSARWASESMASPCSALEKLESDRRIMGHSIRKLEVIAQWGKGRHQRARLITLVGSPSRECKTVEITCNPNPPLTLAEEGMISASVRGLDSANQPIPDLFFSWNAKAISGAGEVVNISRDGRQATFVNHSHNRRGKVIYTGGICKIQSQTLCLQREVLGFSPEITLEKK